MANFHERLPDVRARIAKHTIRQSIAKSIDVIRRKGIRSYDRSGPATDAPGLFPVEPPGEFVPTDPHNLPKARPFVGPPHRGLHGAPGALDKFHVGIVGAGMAGLYTAMMLKSLKIKYEILEASDRIGGRVYTHRFTANPGDYYDVGAMRFPDMALMGRTFDLFGRLGIVKDRTATPPQGTLIPYYFSGPETPSYFNNVLITGDVGTEEVDPYGVSVSKGGKVLDHFVVEGVDNILESVFGPWKEDFIKDFDGTWARLMELDAKAVSVRQQILTTLEDGETDPGSLYYVSNWCETMDTATCHYDEAFVSLLMHSLEFDYPVSAAATRSGFNEKKRSESERAEWWCLNGGSDVLATRMTEKVGRDNIQTKKRVTAISRYTSISTQPDRPMLVKLVGPDGEEEEKSYSHVITTTTTPCLQTMDLREAGLNYAQREAIRVLRYDNSVKLGIKFKRKWWIANGITKGGLGKTDRPTRVVVYPSYALGDPVEGEGVLLACYNWSVDAARIGSLSRGSDPTNQERILDVVIQDLAIMHDLDPVDLHSWVDSYHFHDWYHDEFTTGAFGMFGPGQFATLFSYLQMPAAGGNLFFVGELTSIYHGWIVAALNSAYRGVHQMLVKEGEEELRLQLESEWGIDPEYEPNPEGPTGWQVFLGSLGPEYDDI